MGFLRRSRPPGVGAVSPLPPPTVGVGPCAGRHYLILGPRASRPLFTLHRLRGEVGWGKSGRDARGPRIGGGRPGVRSDGETQRFAPRRRGGGANRGAPASPPRPPRAPSQSRAGRPLW